jgi:hypothetical protein
VTGEAKDECCNMGWALQKLTGRETRFTSGWEHELQARLNTALEIELERGIGKGNFERPRYFILESFSVIGSINSKPAHPAFVIFVSGDTNAATLESLHDRLSLSWASKFSSLTLESKISSMT